MAAIRSKDTKPEMYLRKLLFSKGYRYRKNVSFIPGHPDIYLAKYNVAIFVNGCFWHRHSGCKYAYMPKSRVEFWNKKFEDNVARDLRVRQQLEVLGIKCAVIWECTVSKMIKQDQIRAEVLNEIEEFFRNEEIYMEL